MATNNGTDDYASRVMKIGIRLRDRYDNEDRAVAAADRLSAIARTLRD